MRNLVLGSEGFVGRALCQHLESSGEEVLRMDIKRGEREDLRSARLELADIERVYFLAWDVGGAKYLYERESQFIQLGWNLRLLMNLMPQLQQSGIPFLFVSSQLAEEYDTVYGVTKRLGEVWTHLLAGVRVRLWNVYGVLETPSNRTHVVSDFVHQAVGSGQINMLTTGEERRQFIHIDDVCRALHMAIAARLEGVYDITSFEWTTIRRVAGIIAEEAGAEVLPGQKIGTTPFTPMRGRVPNWLPQVSLVDGLRRMVRDLRTAGGVEL